VVIREDFAAQFMREKKIVIKDDDETLLQFF